MTAATKRRHTRILSGMLFGTLPIAASILLTAGCTRHTVRVEPVEVKPIHVTMDINLRVQKELDRFFEWEDEVTPQSTSSNGTDPEKADSTNSEPTDSDQQPQP